MIQKVLRIENLFFGAKEPKTGAVVSVDNFLDKKFLNHKVSYSGGHMERSMWGEALA